VRLARTFLCIFLTDLAPVPSIINSLIATVVFVPVVVAFAYILPQPSIVYPSMTHATLSSPPDPLLTVTILALSLIPVILLVPMLIITNRSVLLSYLLTQH
jgi:hypothetical protein